MFCLKDVGRSIPIGNLFNEFLARLLMQLFKIDCNSPDRSVVECSKAEIDKFNNKPLRNIIFHDVELNEKEMEDILEEHIEMLDPGFCVIGRQVETDVGGRIDLLAIDRYGGVVIIELKRVEVARNVNAQILGYAAWVKGLAYNKLNEIIKKRYGGTPCKNLRDLLWLKFGVVLEEWNNHHSMYVIAPKFNETAESIILDGHRVGIKYVQLNVYRYGSEKFVRILPVPYERRDSDPSEGVVSRNTADPNQ